MNSSISWNAHLSCTSIPRALMTGSVSVLKQTADIQRWHPISLVWQVVNPHIRPSGWSYSQQVKQSCGVYQLLLSELPETSQSTYTANIWVFHIWTIASQSVGRRSLGIHVYWRKLEWLKFFVKIKVEIHPELKILLYPRQVYQFPGNEYQIILKKQILLSFAWEVQHC